MSDQRRPRPIPVPPIPPPADERRPAPRGGQPSEAPNQSFASGAGAVSAEDPAALAGNQLGNSSYPQGNQLPAEVNDDRPRKAGRGPRPGRGRR